MESNSENEEIDNLDINMDGNIDQSDLLTHKSKMTDLSKKESEKSNRRLNIENKNYCRLTEKITQGYDIASSDQDVIQQFNPSK